MNLFKITLLIVIVFFLPSCYERKELTTIGFAFNGDNIVLRTEKNAILNINVNASEEKTGVCSFYRKIKFDNEAKDSKLNIEIYTSQHVKVLDTFVNIPKDYKRPFISFIDPSIETNYKRKIFIGDEADSSFIK